MEITEYKDEQQALQPAGVSDVSESRGAAQTDVMQMISSALAAGQSVETIERLVALRDRMKAEWARERFFAALSEFQRDMPTIVKNRKADRYRYADLAAIVSTVKRPLAEHGFSYTTKQTEDSESVTATVVLHHADGHSEESSVRVPIDVAARINGPQKVGSARTYALRYALSNALGIVTGDEDYDAQSVGSQEDIDEKVKPYIARQDACSGLDELRELMRQLWSQEIPARSPLRGPLRAHFDELKEQYLAAETVHGEVVYD